MGYPFANVQNYCAFYRVKLVSVSVLCIGLFKLIGCGSISRSIMEGDCSGSNSGFRLH